MINWFIGELPEGIIVVSGGAHGVDTTAAQAARARGLTVLEYLPELEGLKGRHEFTQAYYARMHYKVTYWTEL